MIVSVARSPLRLFTYAVLSVPAILLAVDMTLSYRLIDHPETREVVVGQTTNEVGEQVDITESVYTDTGRAQRRRDILLGSVLLLGGSATILWSLRQLIRPTPFLSADDDGLLVRIDGIRGAPRRIGWEDIVEIRSGMIEDDGVDKPVLSIRMEDETEAPVFPGGGIGDPPWLHLYTDEWEIPAHQVAARLEHFVSSDSA